jgi:hypothetical protein
LKENSEREKKKIRELRWERRERFRLRLRLLWNRGIGEILCSDRKENMESALVEP